MISARALTFTYPNAGEPALRGIDLDIADGEFVVIAGDSGSGKSTLVRALCGLVPHFSGGTFAGSVTVDGRDTRANKPRDLADVIGFVAQDPESQSVSDRVDDEIVFAMENLGVAPVTMRKRLEEVLDALGLAPLRDRALDTLSGGERQRVAIAAALVTQPKCLLLDEPTSQLDPQSAEDVLAVLQRLNADLGIAIIVVEHRLERVAQFAERIVVMSDGKIAADDEPRRVLSTNVARTPLTDVARALSWEPVPLTIREGRVFAASLRGSVDASRVEHHPKQLGETLIETSGLRVARAGREVLDGIDLRVNAGETLAIVGRNGSGKTTLLRALLGLLRAHAGWRTIAGFDPSKTPVEQIAARVAYVPQVADSVLFHETVREEIAFTLKARAPHMQTGDVIARAGLEAFAALDPRDLSAGQRLRVALLAATAGDPSVVLLDEPTRGMDARGKDQLTADIDAWRQTNKAVVLVTHDVELVARAATRVALMAEGRIVLDGPVDEVLGESQLFSSQMNKVFGDRRVLTVEHALQAVGVR